jgi:aminopeptidase N
VVPLNPKLRAEMGPIAGGYRANTADARGAYIGQVYMRGPWVLHMLRVILRDRSGSDDLFIQALSDFVREHDGGTVTTDDFFASLTRTAPGDWGWFFDQWIYGTAIPTYTWSWESEPGGPGGNGGEGGRTVALTVRQSDVPDGFRMPVPVAIDLEDGTSHREVVWVDEAEETFRIPVPGAVRRVDFNPDRAVLAKLQRR